MLSHLMFYLKYDETPLFWYFVDLLIFIILHQFNLPDLKHLYFTGKLTLLVTGKKVILVSTLVCSTIGRIAFLQLSVTSYWYVTLLVV